MPETITTRRAAALLGKTVRQVHHLVDTGRIIPIEKLDGQRGTYVFDPADIDRLRHELLAAAEAQLSALRALDGAA